ncbi:kinetochore protein SPC24 homolog [Impatiens glandulifera]|uniref:kinetochore protein SPC24 homolog n=1 Tax=Impatiens glandulifera TaxID=253017 RepID=UPI001FB05EB5|nr:kinetochore protein SPC24 homolog [Impatiens glandulifera]
MANSSKKIDLEDLISYSNDLIQFLKDKKDSSNLAQQSEQSKSLYSQCDNVFNDVQNLVQGYQNKINECKKKVEVAKLEADSVGDLDSLQNELEDELQIERLLKEELRDIDNDINDLENQRISLEERRQVLKKLEQDEQRTQMKLSMYASVTNIIPNLDDNSKVSGLIVQRDKQVVEKFEFDHLKTTPFDSCNSIWKMIKHLD